MVPVINGILVAIFGIILSAVFCDVPWTRKKQMLFTGCTVMLLSIQGIIYFFAGASAVRLCYPVITHIPLVIILYFFSKKCLWSVVAVLTAYLCCQLRRWLALLAVVIGSGGEVIQNIAEIVITLPLLFVLVKYAAPAVRAVSHYTITAQYQFSLIPALYYGFDYITQIYTDSMSNGSPVIVEFMQFVCSAAYLVFVVRTEKEGRMRSQLERMQDSLNLQVMQAVREIEILRESQQRTNAYRHDLRHHMQYLLSCIENDCLGQAEAYIHGIFTELEANKVRFFCKNEAVNLIFSAYEERAKVHGIPISIQAGLPQNISISENDLCVLLSNALENALDACRKLKEKGVCGTIEVSAFEKNGRLCFQVVNTCDEDVIFDNGIPVTTKPGHGIGVRSICALVERHRGIYTFTVEEGKFILRVSI